MASRKNRLNPSMARKKARMTNRSKIPMFGRMSLILAFLDMMSMNPFCAQYCGTKWAMFCTNFGIMSIGNQRPPRTAPPIVMSWVIPMADLFAFGKEGDGKPQRSRNKGQDNGQCNHGKDVSEVKIVHH